MRTVLESPHNMIKPPISLIISLCDDVRGLDECLRSVESQDLTGIEVIIVDGGSSDAASELLIEWSRIHPMWRIIRLLNRGAGYSENTGITLANGDFISFLRGRDVLHDGVCTTAYESALANNADVVTFACQPPEGSESRSAAKHRNVGKAPGGNGSEDLIATMLSAGVTDRFRHSIIKKSLLTDRSIYFPLDAYRGDLFVAPKVHYLADRIFFVDEFFATSQQEPALPSACSTRNIANASSALGDLAQFLKQHGIYDLIASEFAQFCGDYLKLLDGAIEASDESVQVKQYALDYLAASGNSFVQKEELENGSGSQDGDPPLRKGRRVLNATVPKWPDGVEFDAVFIPHNRYHALTMMPIAKFIREQGRQVCFVSLDGHYPDEGAMSELAGSGEVVVDLETVRSRSISYRTLVCMNDWEPDCVMPLIVRDNIAGIPTIGIVEGIQDFHDVDTGVLRAPYRWVRHLLLSGMHDKVYFSSDQHFSTRVIGIPRLAPMLERPVTFPDEPLAVINCNFTYGVLEDRRDRWLRSAIEGCGKAGIDYVITQHPRDLSDLSAYNVSARDMYSTLDSGTVLVSRFSSAIIEALCLGKPVVYHNPGVEQVEKFSDPMGAFSISEDAGSLACALKREIERRHTVREYSSRFLETHCNISSIEISDKLAGEFIIEKINRFQCGSNFNDELPSNLSQVFGDYGSETLRSSLSAANAFYRQGKLEEAHRIWSALYRHGGIYKSLIVNLRMCEKRMSH